MEKKATKKSTKRRKIRQIPQGNVYIQATYNNTLVTVTDPQGNTIAWSSAGNCGFKGPKKATPYAAGIIIKTLTEKIAEYSMKELHVFVRGVGSGRDSAVRSLQSNGFQVLSIKDLTSIPHNGCRARRVRRM